LVGDAVAGVVTAFAAPRGGSATAAVAAKQAVRITQAIAPRYLDLSTTFVLLVQVASRGRSKARA
jgi:hypothetical protein